MLDVGVGVVDMLRHTQRTKKVSLFRHRIPVFVEAKGEEEKKPIKIVRLVDYGRTRISPNAHYFSRANFHSA